MEVDGMPPGPEGTVPVRDDSTTYGYRWETGPGKALTDAKAYTDEQVAGVDLGPTYITRTVAGPTTITAKHGATYDLSGSGLADFTGDLGTQVAVVVAGDSISLAGEATVEGTYVLHLTSLGWQVYPVGGGVALEPDTTAPTAGTLSVTVTETTADLSVTGAMDDRALALTAYRWSNDSGTTWTDWTPEATYTFEGLQGDTEYVFAHEVRDRSGNATRGGAVTTRTTPAQVWTLLFEDDLAGVADGTGTLDGRTVPGTSLTWGASTAHIRGESLYGGTMGEGFDFGGAGVNIPRSDETLGLAFEGDLIIGPTDQIRHGSNMTAQITGGGVFYPRGSFTVHTGTGGNFTGAVQEPGTYRFRVETFPKRGISYHYLNGALVAEQTVTADTARGINIKGANGQFKVDNLRVEVSNV